MEFAVTAARRPAGTVLAVAGELDVDTAPGVTAAVTEELARRPAGLVVDLTATTFADSSACRVLVQTSKACARAGCALEVVCPRGNTAVRRVLDLVGLDAVVPLRETLADTRVAPVDDRRLRERPGA